MKNDMSVLNRILKTKQEEVTERKNRISERDLMSTLLAGRQRLSMRKALEESATGIIAEFKRKSPSGGFIHEAAGVQEVVGGYVRNGAAACSVLTDTDYFGGSLLDLAMARRVSDIPLLRKDFIVDSYQLAEAVAYGADAVLLIAAALSPAQCRELASWTGIGNTIGNTSGRRVGICLPGNGYGGDQQSESDYFRDGYLYFFPVSFPSPGCLSESGREWNSCHGDSRRVTQIGIQRISDR